MLRRSIRDFTTFMRKFWSYLTYASGVLLVLILLLLVGGILFSWWEGRSLGDAIYFSFITGLSVGYGDIHPTTMVGRILSVFIGLTGMILMGVTVAVANRALADTIHIGQFQAAGEDKPKRD